MKIVNKVGLEAEFFLTNKKGELLFPSSSGFSSDDFIILGEFRAEPGTTREETASNFMKEWYKLQSKAKGKEKIIDIEPHRTIDGDFFAKIMRKMGTKEISQAKNIYGTDILKESDAQITRGKIVGHNLSIGLHIHFSSTVTSSDIYKYMPNKHLYSPIKIPLYLGEGDYPTGGLDLYTRVENPTKDEQVRKVEATVSRITKPVLYAMVKAFDDEILPDYVPRKKLKFRSPGFYELKSHGGFEYRSLPMSQKVLTDIFDIVDFSFSLLEELDL
jgi:hypothetical protein